MSAAKQYETCELCFRGPEPEGSEVQIDLAAVFSHEGKEIGVKGFYAGNGEYRVRFLPEDSGTYTYRVTGTALPEPMAGTLEVQPAGGANHGPVRPAGTHLRHADGTWFYGFGTTVYAMAHQSEAVMEETFRSLERAPFNKIRMCVFPKHYVYNTNNPARYPFRPREGAALRSFSAEGIPPYPAAHRPPDDYWDVHHPDFAFWDAFEDKLLRMAKLGIQVDLILFHPYDRWGFDALHQADNLVYLDYLLRRFAAYPHLWWSLANEYDLSGSKTPDDWHEIEEFVAANDPWHHMLGNHNCFVIYDPARENITHMSWQTKQLFRVGEMARKYGKPILVDECRYEGNIPEFFGNLSGRDMTRSFWKVAVQGGHCTHGETYLPGTPEGDAATGSGEKDVVWWARGGVLHGESPARIAFLRRVIESLPGPLEPMPIGLSGVMGLTEEEIRRTGAALPDYAQDMLKLICSMSPADRDGFFAAEYEYAGHCGEDAYLYYKDDQCSARAELTLPEGHRYQIDVLDTWEMTRGTVLRGVSGTVRVDLPGKPYMAVLALREDS